MATEQTQKQMVMAYLSDQLKAGREINDIKPTEIYTQFPALNRNSARDYLNKFKKQYTTTIIPHTTIEDADNTTTVKVDTPIVDTTNLLPDTTIDNKLGAVALDLLNMLIDNRALLEAVLERERVREAKLQIDGVTMDVDGLIKTGKEYNKDYNYNLSIDLHKAFEEECKAVGLSLRKGLHLALKMFIDAGKKIVTAK
ncbi:hypothetical protein MBAV_000617 [Candidatus Magnetobacterium bavaricum]|uniref:Uncharacterized protein n=1 Tax=Candidatus Magnetobacterium bavaricum TaxID=29290 RepID=A0A0F3H2L8_9BACT|nr:hypothetical protein MBAV_000617 [Candidatus Magnetobacterium bavaricum]